MNSSTETLASPKDCTNDKMGTEHCDFSEKAAQISSECLDNEHRVIDTVVTNSVIDEKSKVSANMTENSVIKLLDATEHVPVCVSDDKPQNKCPLNGQNEHGEMNDVVSSLIVEEQTDKMGTEHCDLSEKAAQISSECLDNEHRVIGTVVTNSVIDENPQASVNMTENSVIQLLDATEHVPVCVSDDKLQNKCPRNGQNEHGEMNDVVSSLVVEEQTQPVPVQLNSNSVNEVLDPPSGDIAEDFCLQKEPGEISDAVTALIEEQTQPVQVNSNSMNEVLDLPCGDIAEDICLQNEPGEISDAVTALVEEQTQPVPVQVNSNSVNEVLDLPCGDIAEDICLQNKPGEIRTALVEEQTLPVPIQVNSNSVNELFDPPSRDIVKDINFQNEPGEMSDAVTKQSVLAQVNTDSVNELLDPPSGDVAKNISSDCLERKSNLGSKHRGKSNSKLSKKYILRSLGSSDRALRSRDSKPKAPEPINNVTNVNNDEVKTKRAKKKKKKTRKEGINDQYSRIRAQLRYYLNRIGYEQNLIDAYSAEGWKGFSLEKLKPEKEIQRAKSEILRRKLKIRDLFQNLDSLCAEGRLPEALFDSEGEIDSEDIFCAKCQTKVLGTNNDIILCDGACDRGYHQLCLDPPLLTEDIPPGDEGWLCPGCDCKDDCIELVNDLFGTSLSLTDSWERVFPEAATAAGSILDHNLGLPSDDSEDDDYNPNGPEDVEVEVSKSSSDESEYASAPENFEDSRHEDPYMGLPSEDSEDDDFDPNALDLGGKVTEESSSSDFTSDSEDLAATIKDSMSTGLDGDITSALWDDAKHLKGSSSQNRKKPSLADELSSLAEPDLGEEDLTPVSGKRNVERLDYQKLYEETYQSDTSDDEDWAATATPNRKRKVTEKTTPVSSSGNASNYSRHTSTRKTHQQTVENTNNSPAKTLVGCTESGSRDKKCGSSYKKLGEAVVQRLYKSFKENQYPERTTKENLAQELGLTYQQVDKWFGNTRWSFRHSSRMEASPDGNASQQATDSRAENEGDRGNTSQQALDSGAENKGEKEHQLVTQETSEEKSRTPNSKKRKRLSEPLASEAGLGQNDSTPKRTDTSNKMKRKKGK